MAELRLKEYQQRTLDRLQEYFRACVQLDDAATAFAEILKDDDSPLLPPVYKHASEELKGLPYVCLRLPTGAGKTLLASHTPGIAMRHLLHAEQCVVLWLVTSETIRSQTLDALKDRDHPYRIALERGLGAVEVLEIDQAIGIGRARFNSASLVIVATIQAFRRDKAEWLRVHRDQSVNQDVFSDAESAPEAVKARLERLEGGERALHSLANALCLRRPIVLVDEAHNANTPLSFDTLAKVFPSAIIEFTATPKQASNILHSVSAAELDAEDMIKMPIRLETQQQWKELIADAVRTRDRLEQIAKRECASHGGEYLRPVMLLQAQRKNEPLTVDVLCDCLRDDFRVPEEQIAIATGAKDTLSDHDIASPDCPIRYIITIDKLREGWDCPFAYVLATVREMQSSTAIEQILGRLMRLPYAKKKKNDDLNRAYAFSVSETLAPALGSLRESLVQLGFNKTEVNGMVLPAPHDGHVDELFPQEEYESIPAVSSRVPAPLPETLSSEARRIVQYDEATQSIVLASPMPESVREELERYYSTPEGKAAVQRAFVESQRLRRRRAPVLEGARFDVPLLCYRQGDLLEPFEDTHFIDHLWQLSKYSGMLTEEDFPTERPAAQTGEVFQDGGRLKTRFVSFLQEQMERLSDERGWTPARLCIWLDRNIPHPDVTAEEAQLYLGKVVDHLLTSRGISLSDLVHEKYRLRDALEHVIARHREVARGEAYQAMLDDEATLVVTPSDPRGVFTYSQNAFGYGTSQRHVGSYEFKKHYYPHIYDLKPQGEEYECACFIDQQPEVRYWVRNIERRPEASFWLQTPTDRFYPDFVCELLDGRILVVEYKGEDRWTNDDSREKRNIGSLWEERSGGTCLFVMPKGKDFGAIREKICRTA